MNETTSTTRPVGQHLHVGPGAAKQSEGGANYRQGVLPRLHLTKLSFSWDAGAAGRVGALNGWQHQRSLLNLAAMRLGRLARSATPAFRRRAVPTVAPTRAGDGPTEPHGAVRLSASTAAGTS